MHPATTMDPHILAQQAHLRGYLSSESAYELASPYSLVTHYYSNQK